MATDRLYRLDLDQRDTDIILGGLRSSHTQCLDAMAACAGAGHGYNWPETEPRDVTGHRDTLDRIERLARELGLDTKWMTRRRADTEAYYEKTAEEYWVRNLVQSHGGQ